MKQTQTVELFCDADELRALIEEMHALLDASPPWLLWLALPAFERFNNCFYVFFANKDERATAATRRCVGRLEPSKDFVLFVTALRAFHGDSSAGVEFKGGLSA